MSKKIITVGSGSEAVEVAFAASAATPILYRKKFGRDIFKDMTKMQEVEGQLDGEASEILSNIAYTMAYQADHSITEDVEEWLEQFPMFALYYIAGDLFKLWGLNMKTTEKAKNRAARQKEN